MLDETPDKYERVLDRVVNMETKCIIIIIRKIWLRIRQRDSEIICGTISKYV